MATLQKKFSDYAEATSVADGDLALISQFSGGSYVTKKINLYQRVIDLVTAGIADAGFARGDYKWTNRPTVPSSNWREANGAIVLISSIPTYVTEYYIGDGNNADTKYAWHYKCTVTGTRDTAGTYFRIPDTRELAPVGVGTNYLTSIVAHDTYENSEVKDDRMQDHGHQWNYGEDRNFSTSAGTYTRLVFGSGGGSNSLSVSTGIVKDATAINGNGTPRVGNTTRGKRFGAYCYVRVI